HVQLMQAAFLGLEIEGNVHTGGNRLASRHSLDDRCVPATFATLHEDPFDTVEVRAAQLERVLQVAEHTGRSGGNEDSLPAEIRGRLYLLRCNESVVPVVLSLCQVNEPLIPSRAVEVWLVV